MGSDCMLSKERKAQITVRRGQFFIASITTLHTKQSKTFLVAHLRGGVGEKI